MSCPTFSSTDIFLSCLSAHFQAFSDGLNFALFAVSVFWARATGRLTPAERLAIRIMIDKYLCISSGLSRYRSQSEKTYSATASADFSATPPANNMLTAKPTTKQITVPTRTNHVHAR